MVNKTGITTCYVEFNVIVLTKKKRRQQLQNPLEGSEKHKIKHRKLLISLYL